MPPHRNIASEPDLTPLAVADPPMSDEKATLLRQLAIAAYEPDAFRPHLTQGEAARRIAMLQAKLKFMDEPPHTL